MTRASVRPIAAWVLLALLSGCGAYSRSMRQGDEYMGSGRHAAAARIYTKALDKRPQDPEALVKVARAWLADGEPELALAPAELAHHGKAAGAERVLATALIGTGQPERAVEIAKEAVAKDPKDATTHLLLAEALLSTSDLEGAVGAAETAIPLGPDPAGLTFAAWIHTRAGNPDRARNLAMRAGGSGQTDPRVLAEAAAVHRAAGHPESASESASLARSMMQGQREEWREEAGKHLASGDTEGALRRISWLRATQPEDGWVALELGELWLRQKLPEQALGELTQARKLSPFQDFEKAASGDLTVASRAVRQSTDEEQAAALERLFSATAESWTLQGNRSEAAQARELALHHAGSKATAEQWLSLSQDYLQLRALDRSLAAAERAQDLAPEALPVLLTMLRIQAARGQVDQAVAYGRRALARAPGDPDVAIPLAELYIYRGEERDAVKLLEASLEAHPEHEGLGKALARARASGER